MLDQQVGTSNFVFLVGAEVAVDAGGVMICHVHLQFVGIGAFWWFPSRFLVVGIEVVRKVLGVGDANLPRFWQA